MLPLAIPDLSLKSTLPVLGGVNDGQKPMLTYIRPESRSVAALFSFYSHRSWYLRGAKMIFVFNLGSRVPWAYVGYFWG